jgi:DNA-binding PadR family transcriptional regulator
MSLAPLPDHPVDHRSGSPRESAHAATGSGSPVARSHVVRRLGPEPLELCMLWLLDDAGALSGLEAINRLAPVARHLDEPPPSFPLLHRLEDSGCVIASSALPRRYEITDAGRQRASDLAAIWRPRLADRLERSLGLMRAHLPAGMSIERRLFED